MISLLVYSAISKAPSEIRDFFACKYAETPPSDLAGITVSDIFYHGGTATFNDLLRQTEYSLPQFVMLIDELRHHGSIKVTRNKEHHWLHKTLCFSISDFRNAALRFSRRKEWQISDIRQRDFETERAKTDSAIIPLHSTTHPRVLTEDYRISIDYRDGALSFVPHSATSNEPSSMALPSNTCTEFADHMLNTCWQYRALITTRVRLTDKGLAYWNPRAMSMARPRKSTVLAA